MGHEWEIVRQNMQTDNQRKHTWEIQFPQIDKATLSGNRVSFEDIFNPFYNPAVLQQSFFNISPIITKPLQFLFEFYDVEKHDTVDEFFNWFCKQDERSVLLKQYNIMGDIARVYDIQSCVVSIPPHPVELAYKSMEPVSIRTTIAFSTMNIVRFVENTNEAVVG